MPLPHLVNYYANNLRARRGHPVTFYYPSLPGCQIPDYTPAALYKKSLRRDTITNY
jgi:hypothetical protein